MVGEVAHRRILMKHVEPLPADAPPDRFSEGRAMHHLSRLVQDIGIRQEGSPGLEQAAVYIRDQLLQLATHASSNVSIEVDDAFVSGSFNMIFLRHSISLAYRNHRNILVRIASAYAKNDDATVLINGHYDSPLGSPGAGDCGSCIASMLEVARLIIDSGWVPPHPIIFLFNGAEELFLLASHGFMTTHKWRATVGAFINIEATGTGGLDLVCQSGPGSWPSWVYAKSAVYPMAHSAAQDIFPMIPGDTDYRIFAEDYGDIPGLDIIFLIGGYFYHTSYDRIENILPGSIQARGENLFSVLKALASSSELQNAQQRADKTFVANGTLGDRPIFFDYLSWFMVFYSKETSMILHLLPMVIVLVALLFPMSSKLSNLSRLTRLWYTIKGMALHAAGLVLAVIVPAVLAFLRLLVSNSAMVWYAHPSLALFMFVPGALLGLLLPKAVLGWSLANDLSAISKTSNEEALDWMSHWGSVACYSSLTLVYLYAGLGGGFLTFWWAVFLILSWPMFCFCVQIFGRQSVKSLLGYAIPLIVPIAFSVYFGGVCLQFLIEKMGMFGSVPQPYGYFVSDIMIACVTGVVVGWCVGPLLTIAGSWLAQSVPMQFLLHFSVVAMALSSQFFPYSVDAPKRVVLQHSFKTTGGNAILDISYNLAVLDANNFDFLFKNVPEVAEELSMGSMFNKESANYSNEGVWMALYPISELFTSRLSYPAAGKDIFVHYPSLPHLFMTEDTKLFSSQFRRIHLELDLGSLQEVWVAVLNITGPLSSWSFSENQLPVPEQVNGGPPSYILRLSGSSYENWNFWLEANSSEALNIDLAVLDQYLDKQTLKLKGCFPSWVDVTVYSSFLSSYAF
ncbi:hypothetical protein SUGI_0269560 [Cryptomeria japonica]|nr:hypothetical protein SUGI_0269560 [Cryptomeria japonica]